MKLKAHLRSAVPIFSLWWSSPAPLLAQEPTPAPDPAPISAPISPSPDPLRVERRIYVPFEDLEKSMKDQGQGVFLPYREFLDMWNRLLEQKDKEKVTPPADGLLASALFTGRVEGEVAVIDAILQVESFKEGWAVLPLSKQPLGIAKADTGKATLRHGAEGMDLLLPEKGKYEMKMQSFSRLQKGTGRQSLTLALPRTPVSRLDLTVPGSGWDFTTEPAIAFSAVPAPDGQNTVVSIFLGEREGMTLSWQKAGGESRLTPLLFADSRTKMTLSPGALQTSMALDYSILRAGVSGFELMVPQPHQVLAVKGDNIKEWNVSEPAAGAAGQLLKVSLHAPVHDHFALTLELEAPVEQLPASLEIPSIDAIGTLRQSGNVEIRSSGGLDAGVKGVSGLAQHAAPAEPDPKNVPAAANLVGNWRFLKVPWQLTLAAKQAEPLVEVESYTGFKVQPDLLSFRSNFVFNIKKAGIFGTRIRLPAGWENVEAAGPAVEGFSGETVGEAAAAQRILTIRFKNRIEGQTNVLLTGRQSRSGVAVEATVPVFGPQDVIRHDALIGVQVDETLEANIRDAGGLKQEDVGRLANKASTATTDESTVPAADTKAGLTIGFRYRGEVTAAVLSLKERKPQVSGEILTLTEIRDQSVSHHWSLVWDVLYSGVDTFYLSVPLDAAGELRVETRTLKEVDKSWKPASGADPAREYWRLATRDKVRGKFTVELSYEAPLGTLGAGKNTLIPVPEIALLELFQETGQIAVTKTGSLEVLSPDKSPALEPADPRELASVLQKPGVFLAWKWKQHPATITLPVSRNELVKIPQAIVTYADLSTVLSTDQALTTEVVYHVRNNTQQYFTLKLPEGARLLSDVSVAGKSQQPQRRADKDGLLIRLPATQEKQGDFVVRFVYDVPGAAAGKALDESGEVGIPAPLLTDAGILQSQLRLYLPSGYAWHDFDSSMHLRSAARGWVKYRRRLGWLVPALGPQLPEYDEKPWTSPPELNSTDRGAFDFQLPKDGQAFLLHRLGQPGSVTVSYRTKRLEHTMEALGVLAGLGLGFILRRHSPGIRFGYLLFGGLGSLVLEAALGTAAGGFLRYFFTGMVLSVGLWLICAFLGRRRQRGREPEPVASPREAPLPTAVGDVEPDHSPAPPQS